jgi:hypothetical protein
LYTYLRVDYYLHPERVDDGHADIQRPLAQDIPNWVSPSVRQLLQVERARKCEEERRRLEQQRANAFADCEKEALVLWQRLGMSLASSQPVCSLEYLEHFVASLKSLVQDAQGLHSQE